MKYIFIWFTIVSASAFAAPSECFNTAGYKYGIDPDLLVAIGRVESKLNPHVIGKPNKNGSFDIGLMQINSRHLKRLKRAGFKTEELLDTCTSIYIGAFILDEFIRTHGRTWRAVGAYNASTESKRQTYVKLVQAEYFKIKKSNTNIKDGT